MNPWNLQIEGVLQENMIHSLVILYSSVPRNITGLYSSVPASRNVSRTSELSPVHSLVNRWIYVAVYSSVNQRMYWGARRMFKFHTRGALFLPPRAAPEPPAVGLHPPTNRSPPTGPIEPPVANLSAARHTGYALPAPPRLCRVGTDVDPSPNASPSLPLLGARPLATDVGPPTTTTGPPSTAVGHRSLKFFKSFPWIYFECD
jgi:hypothetical protein